MYMCLHLISTTNADSLLLAFFTTIPFYGSVRISTVVNVTIQLQYVNFTKMNYGTHFWFPYSSTGVLHPPNPFIFEKTFNEIYTYTSILQWGKSFGRTNGPVIYALDTDRGIVYDATDISSTDIIAYITFVLLVVLNTTAAMILMTATPIALKSFLKKIQGKANIKSYFKSLFWSSVTTGALYNISYVIAICASNIIPSDAIVPKQVQHVMRRFCCRRCIHILWTFSLWVVLSWLQLIAVSFLPVVVSILTDTFRSIAVFGLLFTTIACIVVCSAALIQTCKDEQSVPMQDLPVPFHWVLLLMLPNCGNIFLVLSREGLDADTLAGYVLSVIPTLALATLAYLAENILVSGNDMAESCKKDTIKEDNSLDPGTEGMDCSVKGEEIKEYSPIKDE
eukprot:Em0013g1115a